MKTRPYRFKSDDISRFLKTSRIIFLPFVTVFYKTNDASPRFAFISPKKMGAAVTRNRARRQIRALFYDLHPHILPQTSIIFIAKKKIEDFNFNLMHNMVLLELKKKALIYENHLPDSNSMVSTGPISLNGVVLSFLPILF